MKSYIKYGLYAAGCGIAWTLISYVTGIERWDSYNYFGFLWILIPLLFIYIGIKEKRDLELQGFISYGKAFNQGILITLWQSFVYMIFTFIYFKWINPGFIEFQFEKQIEKLQEQGMDESQLEQSIKMTEKFMGPVSFTISSFFAVILAGTLISLILAAILKKENPEEIA